MVLDTSTILPSDSQKYTEEAKKTNGITFLDSPMSGGIVGARNGTLAFMVGAEEEKDFEHAKKCLDTMSTDRVFHCGGPGSGSIAKVTNNLILGIQMVAVAEGLAIGKKLGGDPKLLSKIHSVSTSRCWATDTYNPVPGVIEGSPASKNYDEGFMVKLIKKDLQLAIDAATAGGAACEKSKVAWGYYDAIDKLGYGEKDLGFVYQYIMSNYKMEPKK
jgi:3-hydroxyisobutyrate dehydrogenase